MPARKNPFRPGCCYHIYNRGAGRHPIFMNRGNYVYCQRLMRRYRRKYGVSVIAYCLMPNHYHFMLRQEADVPLSKFVGVLFNAYTQALNRQQRRTGTLFESRFKHVSVQDDVYAVHLCRYIHLNPVKARLVPVPEAWPFSNYRAWIGLRGDDLVDEPFIRAYFPAPEAYRQFVLGSLDRDRHPSSGFHASIRSVT